MYITRDANTNLQLFLIRINFESTNMTSAELERWLNEGPTSVVKKDNARHAYHQVWSRSHVLPVVFFQVTVCKVKNDFIVFTLQANWFALQANW